MFATGWKTLFAISILLFIPKSFAETITIFDVRNTLPLADDEPTYRDYYVNAGSEQGLREGMVITVKRKVALYDSYRNKSPGDLLVEVGKVKIIYVQNGIAVARDHSRISRKTNPLLPDDFVMVGDELDLSTASREKASQDVVPPSESDETAPANPAKKEAGYAIDFRLKS